MYKTIFNKRNSLKFNRFSNKSYSLFAVLGREVLVGALSVATLSHAKAAGVSTEGAKVDSTLYKGGKAYELDAVSVTGSRAPMAVGSHLRLCLSLPATIFIVRLRRLSTMY